MSCPPKTHWAGTDRPKPEDVLGVQMHLPLLGGAFKYFWNFHPQTLGKFFKWGWFNRQVVSRLSFFGPSFFFWGVNGSLQVLLFFFCGEVFIFLVFFNLHVNHDMFPQADRFPNLSPESPCCRRVAKSIGNVVVYCRTGMVVGESVLCKLGATLTCSKK